MTDLNVLNEAEEAHTSYLPTFGLFPLNGVKVFGIRHEADVMVMPGDRAIDFCLAFAEFVVEKTGSIDTALLARLLLRTERLAISLRDLADEGSTHADPSRLPS